MILNQTPLLSSVVEDSLNVVDEFGDLKDQYQDTTDKNQLNLETLDLFLKYHVVSYDSAKELIDSEKLKIEGADSILSQYEGR